jgi:hypothetical protein
LLELSIQSQIGTRSKTLRADGCQPNRNQQQNVAFSQKLAGDVRNSSSKMFTAAMEISHHPIGSILIQDEEVTLLQSQRLEF